MHVQMTHSKKTLNTQDPGPHSHRRYTGRFNIKLPHTNMNCLSFILLLSCFSIASGFLHFQDRIPNGKKVPHPCKPNYTWGGVGHENVAGGGTRNPFGRDFDANGQKWDECLCETDSDGDGKTNGEELGDPECVWTLGSLAPTTKGLSHPGVCEPIDDPYCIDKNEFEIDCSLEELECAELEENEDVRNITIHITPTAVPAQETTYICQLLDLPDDGEFHMIAATPFIDNPYVLHHIIVYGCSDENADEVRGRFENATFCGMESSLCPSMITLWGLGSPGFCVNPEYGIRLGINGFKYALIETHWNNPELRDDYIDGSGMTLYYTPNLRPNDGSTAFIGTRYLELPQNYRVVSYEGHCNGECTQYTLNETIKIAAITPHMHYMGRKMVVEKRLNGETVSVILTENEYNYDNPHTYQFKDPIDLAPGEEIHVTCTFDTVGKDGYTFEGEATSDEMCYAITQYYPVQERLSFCVQNEGMGWCGKDVGDETAIACAEEIEDYLSPSGEFWPLVANMTIYCDKTGDMCYDACKPYSAMLHEHVCYQQSSADLLKWILRYENLEAIIQLIASCDERPDHWIKYDPDDDIDQGYNDTSLCVDPVSVGSQIYPSSLAILLVGLVKILS